jgi:hypothetical protein
MNQTANIEPRDLTREQLLDVVERVREVLWPAGNEDESWSPDTLDAVAEVFMAHGLAPWP